MTGRKPTISMDGLIDSFVAIDVPQTTALLHAIHLIGPDSRRAQVSKVLAARSHPMPDWVTALPDFELEGCHVIGQVFGDGDNYLIGGRWPGDRCLSMLVYIDHNLGTMVKDAFIADRPVDGLVAQFEELAGDDEVIGLTSERADWADARTRLEEAIAYGDMVWPPTETATWPQCRALVEWMVGLLPSGGAGYEFPAWSEDDEQELVEAFFSSEHGRALGENEDTRGIVETLIWLTAQYRPCDPLRWSPASLEVVMLDRFPRKVVAPKTYMNKFPKVVKAFILYAHHERGMPSELTAEVMEALKEFTPVYREIVADTGRPQGAHALAEMMRQASLGGDHDR